MYNYGSYMARVRLGLVKNAFDISPEMKLLGLQAAGGAATGAGVGALTSDEGERGRGALRGAVAGGLTTGALGGLGHVAQKPMMQVAEKVLGIPGAETMPAELLQAIKAEQQAAVQKMLSSPSAMAASTAGGILPGGVGGYMARAKNEDNRGDEE